jgi:hypothetical protein
MKLTVIALSLVLVSGCFGSSKPLVRSVAEFKITPLPTMVAKKIDTPLYLVASPSDFPDRVHIDGMQIAVFTVPPVDLSDVRAFVTKHLRDALGAYFTTVNVVDSEAQLPKTPHLSAQLKLTKLEYDRRVSTGDHGQRNDLFGAMEWAFGLRSADASEFVFTFSERTTSAKGMTSFGDSDEWQDTFNEALRHLLAAYDQRGVQSKLLQTSAPAQQ